MKEYNLCIYLSISAADTVAVGRFTLFKYIVYVFLQHELHRLHVKPWLIPERLSAPESPLLFSMSLSVLTCDSESITTISELFGRTLLVPAELSSLLSSIEPGKSRYLVSDQVVGFKSYCVFAVPCCSHREILHRSVQNTAGLRTVDQP